MDSLNDGDAQHRAMCLVNEGEWDLFLNERQRQLVAVEFPRAQDQTESTAELIGDFGVLVYSRE
jgi:hypothetical protein